MKKFPGKVTIMWEKRFPYSTTILSGVCLLLLWTAGSQAAIQNKTLASLVARDQGILPGSRITEVLRLDITETDTSTPDNPADDGAATLESLEVSFSELLGTEISELSTVSLYRIGQPIDDEGFDFQRDFKFSNNQLLRRQPVDSALVRFENLNETILNTKAIFFIAITTDVTLDNNDEFSVIVGNIVVTHPESADPKPNLKRESETLTCVDFAGDLMPEADYVRSNGIERDFPFAPYNYKDFSYQHPDALNELYDLEVPTVLPAESVPTAVLGIELAGVRSELQAIRLNFTSVVNGVNNDTDYFIDEDYYAVVDGQVVLISQSGVYDPFIDELVRDVDKDGFFSAADVVLYPGINGFIDAERKGVDDDGDGLIDEEKRNLFRLLDGFDLYEVNEDRDFYIDENGDGRFSPGQDEVYKDYDGDGCYSDGGSLDLVLFAGNGGLEAGVTLSAFSSDSNVAFVDRNGNGRFDPATEIVLRDLDQNGKVGATADRVVDFDGAISTDPGSAFFQDVELGQTGSLLVTSDRVLTDNLVNPTIVFRDITPYNGIPDGSDQVLVAPAGVSMPTNASSYVNVATASPQTWYYHDRNDSGDFEAGEDVWIDVVAGQPEFLDQSELETVFYQPAGAADPADGESEPAAAQESLLAYYDADLSGGYDEGEPILYEQYLAVLRGRGYTAQAEGLQPGANGVYSLAPGAVYPVGNALVDEDHGYTVLQPLVDEDLQNRIAYYDEDGVPGFSLRDLDGDNDYFPIYEDLNRNGRLDQIDNNKDGDFDDQDDYNEDLNGDGNLDLGIGGDEIYIDYDGDGLFDPDVGGQLRSVSELFFAGDNSAVQLRASQPYNIKGVKFLAVDEDGDGERGGATVDSRMLVALGLFPALPPFAGSVSIQIPVADGIDNDSDGVIDEGINEDLGDSAFDAFTVYNVNDTDFSNDILVSDIERILIYRDNPENLNGRFDADEDVPISRHDPEEISWYWTNITGPVYTAQINVSVSTGDEEKDLELRQLPVTDGAKFDYFVVVYTDGDDDGDEYADFGNAKLSDGLGLRYGDDFQISLARDGIITDGGQPNARQITKPIESILHIDDTIGFVSQTVQADDGRDEFVGNPYFDATSSPIGVLGMNIANSPIPKGDGTFENDVLEQVRVFIQRVTKDEVSGAEVEGFFDIDEDSGVVTLPDLMPLADDSSGGIGIYRDDDTPLGNGKDDDGDDSIDEELLNGIDDDGDGLIDEDVGDDDSAGRNGVFDALDDPLLLRNDTGSPLSFRLVSGSTDTVFVDLNLMSGSFALPNDATGTAEGYDYYVVLRTSDGIDYRDTWRVFIEDQGVRFRGGRSAMNTGVSTDSIAANVPVILTDLTRVEPSQQVQTVQANSEPTVVVGLNLYDRTGADRTSGTPQPASLEYIRVTFDNVGSDHDFTPSDLLPISTVEDFYPRGNGLDDDGDGLVDEEILDGQDNDGDGRTDEDCEGNGQFDPLEGEFDWNGDGIPNRGRDSGVAIYRDSALYGKPGVFDPADELVYLDGDEVFGNLYGFPNTIQLNLDRFGDEDGVSYERIPADDLGSNQGNDYFVVIRTSSAVSNGDDFRVRVSPVAANGVVEWPMHFQPRQTNGIFEYTYSYEAVATNVLRANTQTDTVFTNLVEVGQKIETNSDPTAVLGINMNDSGNNPARRLNRVKVRIYAGLPGQADNAASGFNVSDLNAFSNTVNSGLSVYRDVSGEGQNGKFDYAIDQRLNQTVSSYIPYYDGNNDLDYVEAEINLSPGVDLPDDELGENKGLDFYVVVRTSSTISLDDFFTVEIQSNGLTFESGDSLGNKAVTTLPLTSNVPVFFSNRTNVYNNQVGANSLPRVAIAMDMNSGTQLFPDRSNESIVSLVVQFNRENDSAFVNTDIADPLTNSPLSGVALYRDNSAAGSAGDGRFNEDEDIYIPLKLDFVPSFGGENEVYLLFDPTTGLTDIPATNSGDNVGADFFIVFRTSESITHNSQFSVTVKDIRFVERNSERSFTSSVVTGWDVNHPPEIELISPVVGDRASSEPFPVRWHGYDDDEAYVSLYYMDESAFQARSILTVADILSIPLTQLTPLQSRTGALAVDLALGESLTQFDWDVTQVAIGDKRVIAIVTDVRQAQSGAYSPGPLRITNELPAFAFAQPDGVADTVVRGTPYTISWTDSDPENNARIELFIQLEGSTELLELPGGRNLYEDADGVSDTYKVTTTQLTPGTYYPVARITDGVLRNGNIPVNEVVCAFPFVVLQNAAPELALLTPDATQSRTVFNGELFEIRWTDKDDDSNAVISLYYDTDRVLSGNEIPIEATNEIGGVIVYATGIPEGTGIEGATDAEDGPDSFLWDVSRLAAGKYYLMARITDGVNPAVLRYSPSFVTIDKKPSFLFVEPDGVEDEVIQGQTFILTWLANDPDSAAKITLYLDTDTDPGAGPADRGFELPLSAPLIDNDGAGVVAFAVNTALLPALTERTLYYPLAKVVDNNNAPLFVYAEYPLAVQPNAAPSLAFTRPGAADASGTVQGGTVYEVRWNDLDPDYEENAPGVTIELYYDTNSSGLDGVPLMGSYESSLGVVYDSTGIPLQDANAASASVDQGRNVFQWDLSDVPVGTYYVYAILKDGLERDVPLFAYSQNSIRVNKKPTFKFLEPDGVADRVIQGLSYEISWIDGDADSNASIELYLSTDRVTLGMKLTPSPLEENSTPNIFEFSSAGFKPGSYYPIAKVADEDTQLTVVSTYAIAVTENATPAVKLLTPPLTGAVVFGDTFEIRWLDSNPDNDPRDPAYVNLYLDTDNRELNGTLINPAPIAQTDTADSYSWNVASAGIAPGTYYLYATIEDRSQRILFDYSDGPLIVPEPGSRFFYGLHTLSRDGVVTSYDTSEERTFTGVDFGYDTGVNLEASLDGKTILAVDEAGVVRAARAGQAIDPAVQEAQTGFEPLVAALQGPGGTSRLPVGDRRVIDLEFDLNGAGYYLLDTYGELYASQGVVDPLITPAVSGIFGWDIARDFEITQTARGGYILAGDGGVVPLGDAPVISTPYFGWDIARDLEVVSGGYYLLDGLGGVYAVGSGVESFSSPYFGVDAAQDLLAIDGGGYFILFDSGKVAIGGDRISAPSGMTQIVSQVYDTGITNLADIALSGDIQTFFSEELIQVSIERFSAAFRARNLAGIEGELSIYYDDGSATSEAAKLQDFQEFFASPYSETENFGLSDLTVLLAEDRQSAIVTGETTLISMEVTETTHSALIERNAIPDENTFSIPSSNIEARNLASTALTFQLAQSQKVTFERQGEPESYILYLDYQRNEFDAWKPRTKFALSEVSKKVLDLEGGEGYTYRVVLVDPSNKTSIITQPLGIRFYYADVQETPEPYTVIFQYSQDSPGFWQIRSVNVPPEE